MSFLRVNGWAIPCSTVSSKPIEIGGGGRSFNGKPYSGRRGIKRQIPGRTARQLPSIARAIEGAILGLGQTFPYDADLYSRAGLNVASSTGTIVPGVAAGNGLTIYDESTGEPESKFGAGSLAVSDATINMLPADSRDAENVPSGFSSVGGAGLAADNTNYVQGAEAIEVTAGAPASGVITDNSSASSNVNYVASVYVYTAGAGSVKVDLMEGGGSLADVTASLPGGRWDRIEVTGLAAGGSTLNVRVLAPAGALVFVCDMFQIEAGTVATPWYDGTRSDQVLRYPSIFTGYDMTFACWARGPVANPSNNPMLFAGVQSSGLSHKIEVFRKSGTNNLRVVQWDKDGSGDDLTAGNVFDGDWHHVAVTYESAGDAAAHITRIYIDGDEAASGAVKPIEPPLWDDFRIGINGTNWWTGLIDDVVVTPYAMTSGQIAALYAMGQAMSPLPRVYVDGDFLPVPLLTQEALGKVPNSQFADGAVGGTFHNDLSEIDFVLDTF